MFQRYAAESRPPARLLTGTLDGTGGRLLLESNTPERRPVRPNPCAGLFVWEPNAKKPAAQSPLNIKGPISSGGKLGPSLALGGEAKPCDSLVAVSEKLLKCRTQRDYPCSCRTGRFLTLSQALRIEKPQRWVGVNSSGLLGFVR